MNFVANLNSELTDALFDDNQYDNDSIGAEIVDSAEDLNEVQIVESNSEGSEGGVHDTCYDEPLAINEQIFDISSE
jgi:hypothetical protein